jgi:multidrug resistance efflux pump
MPENDTDAQRQRLGRIVSISIIAAALITGALVVRTNKYPRTDDAEVFANFIGIAPQVDGPITQLAVQDNQFANRGSCFFRSIRGHTNTRWKKQGPTWPRWRARSSTSEGPSPPR